jgi:uncharacterized protein YjbJ (UPF0337 family)
MNSSTKDKIKGGVDEVKGKIKETAGRVTNNPDLEAEGKAEKTPAKLKKKSGRSKRCSRSKLGGLYPELVGALGTTESTTVLGSAPDRCQDHEPTTSSQEHVPIAVLNA